MSWYATSSQHPIYQRLPKIDLHRHLEGSMRLETLMEMVKIHGITLPTHPNLHSLVKMQPEDPLTFSSFLAKFSILRLFYRSPELIARITREAIADAAADGVQYLDLNFTPVALSRYQGFSLADVMDWVAESAAQAGKDFHILVNLIASVNRHESVEQAEEVVGLAIERKSRGVVALDLAGNEAEFKADPFINLFREAKSEGMAVTLHAGEWGGAENVRQALEDFQADRIVHGVRVLEDPGVVALAREMGTPFEVCLTSNLQTGVFPSLQEHSFLRMMNAGINVTLNTDDPSVSQISLSDEYWLACEQLGLSKNDLEKLIFAAAKAAFLPPDQQTWLVQRLDHPLSWME
jgi:adenosine deaminase